MAFIPPVPAIESEWEEVEDGTFSPVPGIHRSRKMLASAPEGLEAKFRKEVLRKFLLLELSKEEQCIDNKNKKRSSFNPTS